MFLNTFNKVDVLTLLEKIKESNVKDLIIVANNINDILFNNDLLTLHYSEDLHKITLEGFNPKKPLYPNYEAIEKLVPQDKFIEMIKPNKDYYAIINM